MQKVLLITLLMGLTIIPSAYAEKVTPCHKKSKTKVQKFFVKQICTKKCLETAINEWISQNTTVEIETVDYMKIKRQKCALVLYEKKFKNKYKRKH